MSSIDGMNALIQLSSAQLEYHQATTQNSREFQRGIQQQGLNHSGNKLNLTLQKFDARYIKECAQADVKRIESRLAREQASAHLTGTIAMLVTAGSLGGALWDAGKDLFGGAKQLGDISKSIQSPPIIPANAQLLTTPLDNSSKIMYMAGINSKGSETVQYFTQSDKGKVGEVRSATITGEDKARILGEEFRNKSFAQIHAQNPDLAEILVNDKSHSMAKGEIGDFLKLVDNNSKLSDSKPSVKQSLIKAGKLEDKGFIDHTSDVSRALGGVFVDTVKSSMPYIQAFIDARNKVYTVEKDGTGRRRNNTMDELESAKENLARADKRLNEIKKNIDAFDTKGAPDV